MPPNPAPHKGAGFFYGCAQPSPRVKGACTRRTAADSPSRFWAASCKSTIRPSPATGPGQRLRFGWPKGALYSKSDHPLTCPPTAPTSAPATAPVVQTLPKTDEQGGLMAPREAQENRAGPPMASKTPGLAWNPLHKKHLTPCSALNICQFDANGIDARTTGHRTI